MHLIARFLDDILLLAGCICILIGLSQWNPVVTWVVGGGFLIGFGVIVGKAKANDTK